MSDVSHIVFIHGLANKPPAADLRRIWLEALAEPVDGDKGFDLQAVNVTAAFVYWADLFYDEPLSAGDYESMGEDIAREFEGEAHRGESSSGASDSQAWLDAMHKNFPTEEDKIFPEAPEPEDVGYERIPLPWFLKKRIMGRFVEEAHDYLFNVDGSRDKIRARVLAAIAEAEDGAHIVIAGHSQGSFIAYDVLTGDPNCPPVDGLMTLGSPLGVDELQDKLVWSRDDGFPGKLNGNWVNVYDPYDAVARLDPKLANDFRKNGEKAVIDVKEENWGKWRHSATKYLKGPMLRKHLRSLANRD